MTANTFVSHNPTELNLYYLLKAYRFLIGSYFVILKNKIDLSLCNENKIRDQLVKNIVSNNSGIRFITEFPELEKQSRIDIKLITPRSLYDLDQDIEIECKIVGENKYIDTKKTFESKNPSNGIMSFVTGKYAEKVPIAGMIGFIKEGDINKKITNISNRIKSSKDFTTTSHLSKHKIDATFSYSYKSSHTREGDLGGIDIYHLFFDFTSPHK